MNSPLTKAFDDLDAVALDQQVAARKSLSGYEWTDEDSAFARRVASAIGHLEPDPSPDEWRECCRRWGPRSRSALGCLLGFVRVAWGEPGLNAAVNAYGTLWRCTPRPMWESGDTVNQTGNRPSEHDALLTALEAAPR